MWICPCLGSTRDLLQFRCTMSAINDWLMIAIDADLQNSMETLMSPKTLPCNRSAANLQKRLDRLLLRNSIRSEAPEVSLYYETQLRLKLWITDSHPQGILLSDLIFFILHKHNCVWCGSIRWPWWQRKVQHYLRHLECLGNLYIRLLPAHIDQFLVTRDVGAVGVRATVKQILNTSVACARGLRDYETYFSEDDSSN